MAIVKPKKMSFVNLATGREQTAQFNPQQLEEEVIPSWNEQKVLGLSHTISQYIHTGNHKLKFKLQFSRWDFGENRELDILFARRYLLHLAYSSRGEPGIAGGSPPRFLFVWPNFLSITCKLLSLKLTHTQFTAEGVPMYFDADVSIDEARDTRLYGDDVLFLAGRGGQV